MLINYLFLLNNFFRFPVALINASDVIEDILTERRNRGLKKMDAFFPESRLHRRIMKKLKGEHSQMIKRSHLLKDFSSRSKEIQNFLKESMNKNELVCGGNSSNSSKQTKHNLLQIPPFNPNSRNQILKKSSHTSEKKHQHSQSPLHVKFDTNSRSSQKTSNILYNNRFISSYNHIIIFTINNLNKRDVVSENFSLISGEAEISFSSLSSPPLLSSSNSLEQTSNSLQSSLDCVPKSNFVSSFGACSAPSHTFSSEVLGSFSSSPILGPLLSSSSS
jgi:hypothetical protein